MEVFYLCRAHSGRLGEIAKTVVYAFRAGNGLAFCWLRLDTTILFVGWVLAIVIILLLPDFMYPLAAAGVMAFLGGLAIFLKKRSMSQTLLFIPCKILCLIDLLSGLHKIRFGTREDGRSEV